VTPHLPFSSNQLLSLRLNQPLLLGSIDRPYAHFPFSVRKQKRKEVYQCPTGVRRPFSLLLYPSSPIRAEGSEDDSPARPVPSKAQVIKNKWEGEDEDDDGPVVSSHHLCVLSRDVFSLIIGAKSSQSDWEASSEEEQARPAAPIAPAKKKGSLKQKLAEKEAARQAQLALGDGEPDYDEDAVLDPRAKARLEKQRELESDLHNATELFGSTTAKGEWTSSMRHFLSLISSRVSYICCRLVRRGPRQDPEIDAQNQGGLCRTFGRHHRAHHQAAPGQAAIRHFCRAPRTRPSRAAARRRCAQGRERTHHARE
jgi:Translation initiation factor eIF3 subunit